MKYARITENVVAEVFEHDTFKPVDVYPENFAAHFVPVPEEVEPFWSNASGEWVAPEVPPAPEPVSAIPELNKVITPIEFKLAFTPEERVQIRAARASEPLVDDLFDLIDDPRLTAINLDLPSTVGAVNYLATKGLIEQDRVDEILMGRPA